MKFSDQRDAVALDPTFLKDPTARKLFRRVGRLLGQKYAESPEGLAMVRAEIDSVSRGVTHYWRPAFRLGCSVLCDLAGQGWSIHVDRLGVIAYPPGIADNSVDERKAQLRANHLVERNSQLSMPSIRKFVFEMERRRLFKGNWHSVFSLMRDGDELANLLAQYQQDPQGELANVIDPYVQEVTSDATCAFTGLKLADIWRYFRHTWTISHQTTPGRRMGFLVRDRAAPFHPVIGIGAIGSPVVQLGPRDNWIGWTSNVFLSQIEAAPSKQWVKWLFASLESLISGIAVTDLVAEGVISRAEIRAPTPTTIETLRIYGTKQRRSHQLYPTAKAHKVNASTSKSAWSDLSKTSLFRSKRALTLATLLESRRIFLEHQLATGGKENLRRLLTTAAGRQAVKTVVRQIKGVHAGIDVMDITVCGSVAPYNALLGGKLVAMLMASPFVTGAYTRRYASTPSIIASAMAGKPVTRKPQLVVLGTTSLYSIAPSQYNRIKVPAERVGGDSGTSIEYCELGRTEGMGSFHFSKETMKGIELYLARSRKGRRVNSIFGEGVNPKLRKVRDALDGIGLPTSDLLTHGSSRVVYGIALASNFREVLLERAKRAKFIIPQNEASTVRLIRYWMERWLTPRIARPETLSAMRHHRMTYPVTHGARVPLPPESAAYGPLFEGLVDSEP